MCRKWQFRRRPIVLMMISAALWLLLLSQRLLSGRGYALHLLILSLLNAGQRSQETVQIQLGSTFVGAPGQVHALEDVVLNPFKKASFE